MSQVKLFQRGNVQQERIQRLQQTESAIVEKRSSGGGIAKPFSYSVAGTSCVVVGGYWIIDGVGEILIPGTTLALDGATAYVFVSKTIVGWTCEIGFQATRPEPNNGTFHYRVLCKCQAVDGKYHVVERGYEGGDIYQGVPMPSAR